uniref:Cyclin-dependent protein kinase inhibitor SMR3 n=1 Tax=Davidia involucrata TaxID=16924 RepID=A0A5B7BST9_DAVIN
MGLEISEEFRPITPIRTIIADRGCHNSVKIFSDLNEMKELQLDDEEEYCHTPKSAPHILKTPLACPPAPMKPRPARRKYVAPPSQAFLQVPHDDLASIFVLLSQPASKKIRIS